MNKLKLAVSLLVFLFVFLIVSSRWIVKYPVEYKNYNVDYKINKNGSLDVIEKLQVDFINNKNNYSGINFKYIFKIDKSKNQQVSDIKLTRLISGSDKIEIENHSSISDLDDYYIVSNSSSDVKINLETTIPLDSKKVSSEKVFFTLTYNISDVSKKYLDTASAEIILNNRKGFNAIKNVKAKISFQHTGSNSDFVDSYIKGSSLYSVKKDTFNNLNFELADVTDDNEKIISVVFPNEFLNNSSKTIITKNKLNEFLEEARLLKNDTLEKINNGKKIGMISVYLSAFLFVFSSIIINLKFFVVKKSTFKDKYLNEIPNKYPPYITSYLLFGKKIIGETIIATLFDLVSQNYLNLELTKTYSSDTCFRFSRGDKKDFDALGKAQQFLMKWLINDVGNEYYFDSINLDFINIRLRNIYKKNYLKWVSLAKKEAHAMNFYVHFPKAFYYIYLVNFAVSILFIVINHIYFFNNYMVIAFIVQIIVFFLFAKLYNIKLTTKGEDEFLKWYAYKNFMNEKANYRLNSDVTYEDLDQNIVYSIILGNVDNVFQNISSNFSENEFSESNLFKTYLNEDDLNNTVLVFINNYNNFKLFVKNGLSL